ncbi:hypothetical protein M7I_1922 [Glarea lozoyensis 74030]|uniref:Uncharacterized protein n=1 Tax=Glarea lozoyensis (strain ATCC 74030 / MF5533) TaxID=1104152 RepID=H0EHE4_GLAL7|nr:hypothetical protein M7I_1922 [Glarea lozoyensis 74030]
MKIALASITAFTLPLLSIASPISNAPTSSNLNILEARKKVTCTIQSKYGANCYQRPWLGGDGITDVVTTFRDETKHDFSCFVWAVGYRTDGSGSTENCIDGNCTWDYAVNWDCYVPGAWTSSVCSRDRLHLADCLQKPEKDISEGYYRFESVVYIFFSQTRLQRIQCHWQARLSFGITHGQIPESGIKFTDNDIGNESSILEFG